jgi:hypothetical protein
MAKKEEHIEIKEEEKPSIMKKIGPWAFLLGLLVAVVAAVMTPNTAIIWGLGALGILVGLFNISEKETTPYLIATIAFMTAAAGLVNVLAQVPYLGVAIKPFMTNIVVFVAPGAAVVALKALFSLARD